MLCSIFWRRSLPTTRSRRPPSWARRSLVPRFRLFARELRPSATSAVTARAYGATSRSRTSPLRTQLRPPETVRTSSRSRRAHTHTCPPASEWMCSRTISSGLGFSAYHPRATYSWRRVNGRVRVLRATDGAREAERSEVFAANLERPFGIAFYPPGADPTWVYVAETNAIVRCPYERGDMIARGDPHTIVPSLTTSLGGHWTRDVAFSNDGAQMFVSVGSGSNVAEADSDERDRADVLVFDPEGRNRQVFASGIRNCVGLAVQPSTGDVWCSTNERDGLGDDLVPDYITRVRRGAFYGWPWYYLGDHQDPRHAGERPELAATVIVPAVLLQAHSASLQMTFYEAAAFPAKYQGGAFASLHGSWNRGKRTGPKVIAVPLEAGVPRGEYEDFMTGFVVDDDAVWARPVGVGVAHDGALLVSEDGNGTIWRIASGGG